MASRIEDILTAMIDGAEYTEETQSRVEELLLELKEILEAGGGGGGGGSTVTQSSTNGNIKVNGKEVVVYDDAEILRQIADKADRADLENIQTGGVEISTVIDYEATDETVPSTKAVYDTVQVIAEFVQTSIANSISPTIDDKSTDDTAASSKAVYEQISALPELMQFFIENSISPALDENATDKKAASAKAVYEQLLAINEYLSKLQTGGIEIVTTEDLSGDDTESKLTDESVVSALVFLKQMEAFSSVIGEVGQQIEELKSSGGNGVIIDTDLMGLGEDEVTDDHVPSSKATIDAMTYIVWLYTQLQEAFAAEIVSLQGKIAALEETGGGGVEISTEISDSSTNEEAAGAKAVYDMYVQLVLQFMQSFNDIPLKAYDTEFQEIEHGETEEVIANIPGELYIVHIKSDNRAMALMLARDQDEKGRYNILLPNENIEKNITITPSRFGIEITNNGTSSILYKRCYMR